MIEPLVDPEAFRLLRAGRLEEALVFAERAVRDARKCVPGHSFLASILLKLERVAEADDVVARAQALDPGEASAYDGLAFVCLQLGQHERANALYHRTVQIAPQTPLYWYNLACSERSLGKLAPAEEACDRCIALDAAQYPAYLLRSELRVQAPEANHIEELRRRLADTGLDSRARAFLGYALAKELDDNGRFDEAFDHFAVAAKERRSQFKYDLASDELTLQRIAEAFPRTAVQQRPDGRQLERRCLFIVGLPRSGTTLVERILSALPGVRSNGETDNFSRALSVAAKGSGDMFTRAASACPNIVADTYLKFARVAEDNVAVIDKLPTNYLYLGAIHRALAGARLVHVSRSPLDSCFAMFRTLFAQGYPFTYDFEELARYYAAYARLMHHWRGLLGGALHEIVYEDLVLDPRGVGAAAAAHCGLCWNDAATDIPKNASVSLTASASQVRRPIYGSSSGRWRHYRRHLRPLIAALRRQRVALPADALD